MPPLMFLGVLFWVLVLGGGAYVVSRFLRAFERRSIGDAELVALRQRVAVLEESLEDVRGSVDRIEVGQEFTNRLLAARAERDTPR